MRSVINVGRLFHELKQALIDESGQNLVEYTLVAVLIPLGAVTAMSSAATAISNAYGSAGTKFTSYTS